MGRILRYIEWFSKKTELLVGKEEIKDFDVKYFKKIFNHAYKDDPDISCGYNIFQEHVPLIQPFIKHRIDLKKYDYQFDTYEER